MLYAIFLICVGIVIGWNLEQPRWAQELQDNVVYFVKDTFDALMRKIR